MTTYTDSNPTTDPGAVLWAASLGWTGIGGTNATTAPRYVERIPAWTEEQRQREQAQRAAEMLAVLAGLTEKVRAESRRPAVAAHARAHDPARYARALTGRAGRPRTATTRGPTPQAPRRDHPCAFIALSATGSPPSSR